MTKNPRCKHCHRPANEHVNIYVPSPTAHLHIGEGQTLTLCPTALYAPACEMCDTWPCKCATTFTTPGSQPGTYESSRLVTFRHEQNTVVLDERSIRGVDIGNVGGPFTTVTVHGDYGKTSYQFGSVPEATAVYDLLIKAMMRAMTNQGAK